MTGRLPFEAATPAGVAVLVSKEDFAPISHYRPGLPPGLKAWFGRALAKDPRQRFATVYDFLGTFTEALGDGVADLVKNEALFRSCLDENELVAMVEGRLSDREMTRIEQHLDGCSACCEFVGAGLAAESGQLLPRYTPRPSKGGLSLGTVVAHRYRVARCLHANGSRDLYDATDLLLQERISLERLPVTLDDEALRRLLRDVRLARHIEHPNVCSTYEVHLYEEQLGGCWHVITSEFVDGETLRVLLQRVGRLSLQTGVQLLYQLLLGLRAVHAAGLVHGDLRPEKIYFAVRVGPTDNRSSSTLVMELSFSLFRLQGRGIARPNSAKAATRLGKRICSRME